MHLHILALLWPAWQHLIPHIFLLVTLMPGSWIATNTQLPECCKKVGGKSDGYFWLNASLPDKKRVTDLTQLFWDCNSYNPSFFFKTFSKNMFSLLYFSSEVIFRRWIVIMISGWLVLMWIWRLFVKIDERGSFLDNVDLNQEPLVLDIDTLPLSTKILQDVSQAPVRHPSGLSIKYPDCGRHYSLIFKEFMIWNKRNCTSLCP